MSRDLPTAFSDLILGGSAIWSYFQLKHGGQNLRFGMWWFMLQAIAALLGVFKFGRFGGSYQASVDKYHKNFSWLAVTIGVPCLGAQCCQLYEHTRLSQIFLVSAIVTFVICTRKVDLKGSLPLITVPFVVFTIIYLGYMNDNYNLCNAGLFFILTAAVGDEGEIPGSTIKNAVLFHYLLLAVNIFSVWGILNP